LNTIYFDWGNQLTTLTNDSEERIPYPTIDALLDELGGTPHQLVCESTFESYRVDKRAEVIDRAKNAGHVWLCTPNRQTGRHRRSLGFASKTDDIDVGVIRDLALTKPLCLKAPSIPSDDDKRVTRLREANATLRDLRRTYRTVEAPRTRAGFKRVSLKEDYSLNLAALLPAYSSLTPVQKKALGDGKKYSKPLLAAAGIATLYSENRREFEHLTGLHAHGYPSQIRSDVHWWTWNYVKKRGGVTLSEFRREVRWLYHRLAELGDALVP
jgi:hypothetical protein